MNKQIDPEDQAMSEEETALLERADKWLELDQFSPSYDRLYAADLVRTLRSSLASAREKALEDAAKWCDDLAYAEECADDTMQGVRNGAPYRRAAKHIRASQAQGTGNNAAGQLPHGVSRADDPNEEAIRDRAFPAPANKPTVADATDLNARGVAPSVSDDSAGTSITAPAAPKRNEG